MCPPGILAPAGDPDIKGRQKRPFSAARNSKLTNSPCPYAIRYEPITDQA